MGVTRYLRGGEWLPPRHKLPRGALPLARAVAGGEDPPCTGDWRFTSDDLTERTAAATTCGGCPLQQACRAAGETATHGVWGGVDRSPRGDPP
ncbi:WhiB family transcriptional regulator [uncultured Pseudokineococcus sp.]|uniref:WhiB family transcriptional regulator n=1 Tax=uncultured Pseudokineococcus sp. TaxID=1642928 RepID=UPI00262091E1|nr:WhiB family transcriptional regulator [uncultured Pseudokineococcus sp.]